MALLPFLYGIRVPWPLSILVPEKVQKASQGTQTRGHVTNSVWELKGLLLAYALVTFVCGIMTLSRFK